VPMVPALGWRGAFPRKSIVPVHCLGPPSPIASHRCGPQGIFSSGPKSTGTQVKASGSGKYSHTFLYIETI